MMDSVSAPPQTCLDRLRGGYLRRGKRTVDLALAVVLALALWPLMLLVTLLIVVFEGRPVFYTQMRVGRRGRRFRIYKFRSMVVSAGEACTITTAMDERITPFGKWLRRFKLDELPQLWNVIRGEMSFVGPRPDVPGYLDRPGADHALILELRPGITGLATLVFRDEQDLLACARDPVKFNDGVLFPAKVRLNLEYLATAALLEDFRLMLRTLLPWPVEHKVRAELLNTLAAEARPRDTSRV